VGGEEAIVLHNDFVRVILSVLANASEPLGARYIWQTLRDNGDVVSETTISRRLRDLDARGWTVQVGSKGRVLTAAGRHHVATVVRNRETAEHLQQATELRTAEDVLHLLRARRAIEPEAARELAQRRELAGIERLDELIEQHQQHFRSAQNVPRAIALGFHRQLARSVRNPVLKGMLDVVLHQALDRIEAALDVILVSHHVGAASIEEHQTITAAIRSGDEGGAEQSMRAHLDRLVNEAERFATEETAPIVARLLTWAN
jgi:DNA-binding FadR family transcriptional regulator